MILNRVMLNLKFYTPTSLPSVTGNSTKQWGVVKRQIALLYKPILSHISASVNINFPCYTNFFVPAMVA